MADAPSSSATTDTKDIVKICENNWNKWKHDCSGFLKAVASDLGISLSGNANMIIDTMNRAPWTQLDDDKDSAVKYASLGYLVVAGLKEKNHGHVVVIVPGPSDPYPNGYWGQFGGTGRKNARISLSWKPSALKDVQYYAIQP